MDDAHDPLQEIDVVFAVKCDHLGCCCQVGSVHVKLSVESEREEQMVRQLEPMWLHGMSWPIIEVADFGIVKIRHSPTRCHVSLNGTPQLKR